MQALRSLMYNISWEQTGPVWARVDDWLVTGVINQRWEADIDLISITMFVTGWGWPVVWSVLLVCPGLPALPVPRQHANQGTKRWTGNLCQFYLQIEIFHWGLRQLWRILNIHNKLSSHHWYTQSIDHLTSSILLRVERRLFLLQFRLVRGEWRGWGWASHCQQINQSTKKRESLFSDELWLISRLSASVNAEK